MGDRHGFIESERDGAYAARARRLQGACCAVIRAAHADAYLGDGDAGRIRERSIDSVEEDEVRRLTI